jgi:hypothetical protein
MRQAKAEIEDGCKGEAGSVTRKALGHPARRAYFLAMPAVASPDLASLIAEEAAMLPEEQQSSVLDYVLFIKQQHTKKEDADAVWERTLSDPRPRPKLRAFMQAALAEGSEPLDLSRL